MTEFLVPVEWWGYADDRLDARCPPELNKAQVSVKAYNAEEARKLVWREWGDYGSKVGTATEVPTAPPEADAPGADREERG